jgi:hypothetical protein
VEQCVCKNSVFTAPNALSSKKAVQSPAERRRTAVPTEGAVARKYGARGARGARDLRVKSHMIDGEAFIPLYSIV